MSPNPGTWATVSAVPHPYAEVSATLGVHLHLATKEKIWRGECADLLHDPEPKPCVGCGGMAINALRLKIIEGIGLYDLYGRFIFIYYNPRPGELQL